MYCSSHVNSRDLALPHKSPAEGCEVTRERYCRNVDAYKYLSHRQPGSLVGKYRIDYTIMKLKLQQFIETTL